MTTPIPINKKLVYELEDGIDFFKELNNIMKPSVANEVISHISPVINEDNICMLSKEPLDNTQIKLNCGHRFNYLPLYKDFCQQKCNGSHMDITVLSAGEIKCPYCRVKTNGLLPFIICNGVKRIHGVNFPEHLCMPIFRCCYKVRGESSTKSDDDGVQKHSSKLCGKGNTLNTKYGFMCKKHNRLMKLQEEREARAAARVAAKAAKVAAKAAVAVDKSSNVSTNKVVCSAVYVSGKNKGSQCSSAVCSDNSLYCKRHAKMNKDIVSQ